ncbi:MAG: hypothetical protein K9W43_01030 [Candidatus Thorarchaeota archaeon]|nr:hypothetical protein [Candidatus Thorarchaeota archaeon]
MVEESIYWLLESAGPIIRFRTIVDLLQSQDVGQVAYALDQLHSSPIVKTWLNRLEQGFKTSVIWSQQPTSFGNVMGKLVQIGMRAGLQPFDSLCLPARAWLTDAIERDERIRVTKSMMVVVNHLSLAGYAQTRYVDKILRYRLNLLYDRRPGKVDDSSLALSATWLDIVGIFHSQPILSEPEWRSKAEAILEDVISGQTRLLLPVPEIQPQTLVLIETLARSHVIRESKWFKTLLDNVEKYRTEYGRYRFPEPALPEKQEGMWIDGAYMAFDDRSHEPNALEYESTFRALQIKQIIRNAP